MNVLSQVLTRVHAQVPMKGYPSQGQSHTQAPTRVLA